MAHQPYRDPDHVGFPASRPVPGRETPAEGSMMLPIFLVTVLVLGIAYYFFGDSISPGPHVRADSGVTYSPPSPN